ncbi:MAG: twin transmembrane helix small protein [Chromatiales bacterium]|nr:MAG: twin transmembrane helix small protein [Chromatiales bacterium]
MKLVVILLFLVIIGSLGSGLFYLVKGKGEARNDKGMVNALTLRITLSVALFVLLFAAWAAGFIQPHGAGLN